MNADSIAALEPHLESVELPNQRSLLEPGDEIEQVYFVESGIISLVSPARTGDAPELASIGREGVAGCVAAIGSSESYARWLVQVPGKAWRCPANIFEKFFDEDSHFRQHIVCYMDAMLSQVMQSVACNATHPIAARTSRWILMMHDRSDEDRLPLTQEFLAEMLSVHRSSVVLTNRQLQEAGLIKTGRGYVEVVDRDALQRVSCDCYSLVRERYNKLLPGTFGD